MNILSCDCYIETQDSKLHLRVVETPVVTTNIFILFSISEVFVETMDEDEKLALALQAQFNAEFEAAQKENSSKQKEVITKYLFREWT